ncbi:unnamed protein product [Pedinophyceae sp. YPF-701]|nr:unnamed protein product [Pedinophyceae sp. YPF-701]
MPREASSSSEDGSGSGSGSGSGRGGGSTHRRRSRSRDETRGGGSARAPDRLASPAAAQGSAGPSTAPAKILARVSLDADPRNPKEPQKIKLGEGLAVLRVPGFLDILEHAVAGKKGAPLPASKAGGLQERQGEVVRHETLAKDGREVPALSVGRTQWRMVRVYAALLMGMQPRDFTKPTILALAVQMRPRKGDGSCRPLKCLDDVLKELGTYLPRDEGATDEQHDAARASFVKTLEGRVRLLDHGGCSVDRAVGSHLTKPVALVKTSRATQEPQLGPLGARIVAAAFPALRKNASSPARDLYQLQAPVPRETSRQWKAPAPTADTLRRLLERSEQMCKPSTITAEFLALPWVQAYVQPDLDRAALYVVGNKDLSEAVGAHLVEPAVAGAGDGERRPQADERPLALVNMLAHALGHLEAEMSDNRQSSPIEEWEEALCRPALHVPPVPWRFCTFEVPELTRYAPS